MTPEEKFYKDVWCVLRRIKEGLLYAKRGNPISYRVTPSEFIGGEISHEKEIEVLEKLQEEYGVIKNLKKTEDWNVFSLEIIQPKFDEVYKEYQNACDINSWANATQEKELQNLQANRDIDEDVPEFLEVKSTGQGNESKNRDRIEQIEKSIKQVKTDPELPVGLAKRKIRALQDEMEALERADEATQKKEFHHLKADIEKVIEVILREVELQNANEVDGIIPIQILGKKFEYPEDLGRIVPKINAGEGRTIPILRLCSEDEFYKILYHDQVSGEKMRDLMKKRSALELYFFGEKRTTEKYYYFLVADIDRLKEIKAEMDEKESFPETPEQKNAVLKVLEERVEKAEERAKIKKAVLEEIMGQQENEGASEQSGKPYTVIENNKGYFKLYRQGEKIPIGNRDTRKFRLLQCLCEPHFGVQKAVEAVFEAIKLPRDKNNKNLESWSPQAKTNILDIIKTTIKELQKNNKLQGKIRYRFDNQQKTMWLQLEG